MKTDDWVLLGAIAAAAFILTRRPGVQLAGAPPMRTGTVTAGPLTPTGTRLSPYQTGQQLLNAWSPYSRPTVAPVWEDA